jgi:hypothetical protein
MDETKKLYAIVETALKKKYNKKSLNADQKQLATGISEAIIVGCESGTWNEVVGKVLNDPTQLDKLGILTDIQNMAAEHQLDAYSAGLLYHSTKYSV